VLVLFDDAVRPASGIAAISNRTRESVLAGKPRVESAGRRLVIGLKKPLPRGDYTVRWRVRSDDGHTLAGVLAFRVGTGTGRPAAALSADSGPSGTDVLRRWLLLLGIALASGGLAFDYLVRLPALRDSGEPRAEPPEDEPGLATTLVVSGFLLALLGLGGNLHGALDTRYDRVNAVGAIAALVGAVLLAVAWVDRRARPLALVPALVLLFVPALRGHALDPGHSRPLSVGADLVHLAAASVWIGGLVQLLVSSPAAVRPRFELLARRFSAVAGAAVAAVALSGLIRALTELTAVDQLWSTGYGRAILVKTAIFAPLVGLGWVNRSRLLPVLERSAAAITRLRVNVAVEVVLLVGLLVAVAVLTALQPGRL
jgi:copper transport protein